MSTRVGPRAVGALVGLCAALLALGPALRPGFLLFYDMVFVPDLAVTDHTLGIDGSVPRAVPNDLIVAVLSGPLPGWLVQKVLLVAVFVLVGAGTAGLLRSRGAGAAAALVACWNPYVGERLAIGHWGFLLGYAVLPFLVSAAGAYREGRPRSRARLGWWLIAVAATGSTGAVIGLLVVLCVLLVPGQAARPRAGQVGWTLLVFGLSNAPWWFTYLLLAPHHGGDPAGVTAFMSRSDTPWGTVPSLLTSGGIWNEGVWFVGRDSWVVSGVALVAVAASLVVALRSRPWWRTPALAGLTVGGVLSLLIAAAGALPGGQQLVTQIVTQVPGGGLLRDGQKFVAAWTLVVAVAAGTAVGRLAHAARRAGVTRVGAAWIVGLVALWPVATLPGMLWGAGGRWDAVPYPTAYQQVAQRIDALPRGGVAVFPWTLYRRYAWNDGRVLLDPWSRLVDRPVLVNDDLPLSDQVVQGESPAARRVTRALSHHGSTLSVLRQVGVRYVLVETDQPREAGIPDLGSARKVTAARGLALYDLGPAVAPDHPDGWVRYLGLLAAGVTILGVAAETARGARRSQGLETGGEIDGLDRPTGA